MQLKQFYNIATKVSSRKSAATFGELPDCLLSFQSFQVKSSIFFTQMLTFCSAVASVIIWCLKCRLSEFDHLAISGYFITVYHLYIHI